MSREPRYKIELLGKYREFVEYSEAISAANRLIVSSDVRRLGISRPEQLVKSI